MAESSGFFPSYNGDRRYFTSFFAEYFADFISNGIYPNPSTQCQVLANNDMTVTLKPGNAYINGYRYKNDSDKSLSIETADGVLKRIDRIVLRYTVLNREIKAYVKKGTFASSPVAPALQRDADMWELGVADIYISAGATSITQANVTDLRLNGAYCGIVHGIIDQVDGETLFIQFQAIFDDFIESLEGVLDENTAGNLLNMINDLVSKIGALTGLTTTEKSNMVGAINELVSRIVDIEADLSVHTTAISNNAQDIESQALELDNHEILKAGSSVLGHVKSDRVDANGNLLLPELKELGRYQSLYGFDNVALDEASIDADFFGKFYNNIVERSNTDVLDTIYTNKGYAQYFASGFFTSNCIEYFDIYAYTYQGSPPQMRVRLVDLTTATTIFTAMYTTTTTPGYIRINEMTNLTINKYHEYVLYFDLNALGDSSNRVAIGRSAYLYTATSYSRTTTNLWSTTTNETSKTLAFRVKMGTSALTAKVGINYKIGDVSKWGNLKWDQTTPAGTTVTCKICDTDPVLSIIKSNEQSSYPAINAFDDNEDSFWDSNAYPAAWIGQQSDKSVVLKSLYFKIYGDATYGITAYYVEGSNDGSAWTSLKYVTGDTVWTTTYRTIDLSTNVLAFKYHRLRTVTMKYSGYNVRIQTIKFTYGETLLKDNVVSGDDLSAIDPIAYPEIKALFTMSKNAVGTQSPSVYNPNLTWVGISNRLIEGYFSEVIPVINVGATYTKRIKLPFNARSGIAYGFANLAGVPGILFISRDSSKTFAISGNQNGYGTVRTPNSHTLVGVGYLDLYDLYIDRDELVIVLINRSTSAYTNSQYDILYRLEA